MSYICIVTQYALLLFHALLTSQGLGVVLHEETTLSDAVNMYLEDAITEIKLRIHKAAQRQHGRRNKRSIGLPIVYNHSSSAYEVQVDSIVPIQSVPSSHPVRLRPFVIDNKQYLAVVNFKSSSGDFKTTSDIYKMVSGRFVLVQQFPTSGCVDFEYAKLSLESYAVFVENMGTDWLGHTTYSRSFHLYKYLSPNFSAKEFEYSSSIGMQGGKAVKTFIHKNKNYFVAANSFSSGIGDKYDAKSSLFLKTQFGFLLVQQFETQGAEDVEVFKIDGLIYLAFAIYNDKEKRVDTYSTIYREKLQKGADDKISFEYAQRILTHGAKDFEYFYFRNNHYLAVANELSQLITYDLKSNTKNVSVTNDYEVDSVIYWWSGKFFVEWQRIPTHGAVKWSSFAGPNRAIMLVVANSRAQALMYTYDPRKGLFKPTKVQGLHPFPGNRTIPDVRSVESFSYENETYLAVANFKRSTHTGFNIFKVKFESTTATESQMSLVDALSVPLNNLQKKIDELNKRLVAVKNTLVNIMTVDGNQTVVGIKEFKKLRSRYTKLNNLIYSLMSENNPVENAVKQAVLLKDQLANHTKLISELNEHLKDSVTKTGSQYVTGIKTFIHKVEFTNLTVDGIKVGLLDGVNVTSLEKRAWSKTKNQLLFGNYCFSHGIQVMKDMNVKGSVNDVLVPDDVMTKHTHQNVTGKKMFKTNLKIIGNLSTGHFTINDVRIPNEIVLKSRDQIIFGSKQLLTNSAFNKSIIVDGTINLRKLSEFSRKVVTLSSDQNITGEKTFLNGLEINRSVNVTGHVDGVNLTSLYIDSVRLDKIENIKGLKRVVGSINAKGDLLTWSTTNDQNLKNDMMTTNTDQIVKSQKEFSSIAVQGNIETTSTVDEVYLSREAVRKSTEETIFGKKLFEKNLTAISDVEVNGTVDGVDISKLQSTSAKINKDNIFLSSIKFAGTMTVLDQLSISGNINRIDLKKLRTEILKTSGNQTIDALILFEDLKMQSNLNIKGGLNGIDIQKQLYGIHANETIFDNIIFADGIMLNNNMKLAKNSNINGGVFSTFANNVMLQGINQTLQGNIIFKEKLTAKKQLSIHGKLNNMEFPKDFVILDASVKVYGKKIFLNGIDVHGELSTAIINVSTTVNDVDLSHLLADVVYNDDHQTINGSIFIIGNVTSQKSISVGKLVDNVNITELRQNVVKLSERQSIDGHKVFLNDLTFYQSLNTTGKINNIDLLHLERKAMKKTGSKQFISGTKTLTKPSNIKGGIYNGTLNGINLGTFSLEIARKNGNQTIRGQLTFLDEVSVGTMTVMDSFDGLKLEDLMLIYRNQIVTGHKTFLRNSTFQLNIDLKKTLNSLNIANLDKNVMKIDEYQNISAILIFKKGFIANENVHIKRFVNNIDISQLDKRVLHANSSQQITSKKTFLSNVYVQGDISFMDFVNRINVSHLFSDVMLMSEEQMICTKKVFSSGVGIDSKLAVTNIDISGFVDDVNITKLNESTVKLQSSQKLYGDYNFRNRTRFLKNVTGKGYINGVNVSSDVLTNDDHQIINGYKSFHGLFANGNINITGNVDGYDISEFAKLRVTLSTNQNVTGPKSFRSNVTITNNIHMPNNVTLNNIDISEELLVTDKEHLICGQKTFDKDIIIMGNLIINGTINGVNITKMKNDILLVDKKNTLTGFNTFLENINVQGYVAAHGYVNGVKIEEIFNVSKALEKSVITNLDTLNRTVVSSSLCQKMKILTSVAGAEVIFTGIEKVGQFSKNKLGQVHAFNVGNTVYVTIARLAGSGCGPAYILRCTPSLSCVTHQIIRTRAVSMQSYKFSGATYIFVGHWGTNSSGCTSFPELLKFDAGSSTFLSHHNITTSLLESIGKISTNAIITKNLLALIPSSLLASVLFKTPITDLGSILTQRTAITKIFTSNRTTYLVTASVLIDIYYIELFILNTSSLKTRKIQQITTREVSSLDIGVVNNKTMLVIAEGRHGSYRMIKIYTFLSTRQLFFFYQRIVMAAVSVTFSEIHRRHYLIFASPEHGFGLCPWRGVIGFGKCWSVPDVGIRYIHTVVTTDGVFAVGTTDSRMVSYRAIFQGPVSPYIGTINC